MPSTNWSIKKFSRFLLMQWSRVLQYRFDAFLWLLAEGAIPLVALAIWYTVAQSGQADTTPQQVLTYYIIALFVKLFTDSWSGIFFARDILSGAIVQDLIRPVPVLWKRIAEEMTEKVFKVLIPVPVFVLTLAIAPQFFSATLFDLSRILLFFLSLALAIIVSFLSDYVIGLLAFWFEDVFQIRRYRTMFDEAASGMLIPLAFMPVWAQTLFAFLPFRYILAAPAEILSGQGGGLSIGQLLLGQVIWIGILGTLASVEWRFGLRRYAVPGQ